MIIENYLQPNCSESVICINKKDLRGLAADKAVPHLTGWESDKPMCIKFAGETTWYISKPLRDLISKMKRRYITRFYYQSSLPSVVVNELRKHGIEFYGIDFGGGSLDMFEDMNCIITQKMIKRRLRR